MTDYRDYVMRQVLAESLDFAAVSDVADDERLDIDGVEVLVKVNAHK
jgi:hypothetical protein